MYTFVDQLCCAFADNKVHVIVISPKKKGKQGDKSFYRKIWNRVTPNGNEITVLEPRMLSFSSKKIGPFYSGDLTRYCFKKAVLKTIIKNKLQFDCIYGHFLSPAGLTASDLGRKFDVPSFCAFGESSLWSVDHSNHTLVEKKLNLLSGIVSVSTENKKILEHTYSLNVPISIFPNGVNTKIFYPRERLLARTILKFPQDSIIGIFVGGFNERKGLKQVVNATRGIHNLKMIYIGNGKLVPTGENILFHGMVAHHEVPQYLSCADFFILPTSAEGSCNAILEAIACGLPIISTDGSFNDDILFEDFAIRVPIGDTVALRCAVSEIVSDDDMRKRMSLAAIAFAPKIDIEKRARNILKWLENVTMENQ